MPQSTRRHFLRLPLALLAISALDPGALYALVDLDSPGSKELFAAIERGDLEAVERLLAQNPKLLGAQTAEGLSGFALALLASHGPIADRLRELGYSPDLHEAALALDWDLFTELARASLGELNAGHAIGGTTLYAAAAGGAGGQIWRVYAQGADPNHLPEGATESPLERALRYPDLHRAESTAATLLANGALPSSQALHRAAERGSLDLVEMLVRKGVEVEARNDAGVTAREVAEEVGHRGVVDLFGRHREIPRDHSTSREAYGADGKPYRSPNLQSISQLTQSDLVGLAHGNIEAVRQRLAEDPRLAHAVSTTTEKAVEAAAHMGRRDMAELLLEHGAPYSLPTAAMLADGDRIRQLLAEDPLRIHERGAHDFALLWYPVLGRAPLGILEQLLAAGAEVERQHSLGTTALHYAALGGDLEKVAFLLDAGADPGRVGKKFDFKGQTPRQLAEGQGHTEVVDLLRQRGG